MHSTQINAILKTEDTYYASHCLLVEKYNYVFIYVIYFHEVQTINHFHKKIQCKSSLHALRKIRNKEAEQRVHTRKPCRSPSCLSPATAKDSFLAIIVPAFAFVPPFCCHLTSSSISPLAFCWSLANEDGRQMKRENEWW